MGLGRERVSGEAVWADKQLEVSIWETKCREAMVQVYWDRVEAGGCRGLDTLQRKLKKRIWYRTSGIGTGAGCSSGPKRRQPTYGHGRGTGG